MCETYREAHSHNPRARLGEVPMYRYFPDLSPVIVTEGGAVPIAVYGICASNVRTDRVGRWQ